MKKENRRCLRSRRFVRKKECGTQLAILASLVTKVQIHLHPAQDAPDWTHSLFIDLKMKVISVIPSSVETGWWMANVMTKPSVLIPLVDSIWNKSIQSCTGLTQSEPNLSLSPKIGCCQQAGTSTSKRFTTSSFCNSKSLTHGSLAERRRAAVGYFSARSYGGMVHSF